MLIPSRTIAMTSLFAPTALDLCLGLTPSERAALAASLAPADDSDSDSDADVDSNDDGDDTRESEELVFFSAAWWADVFGLTDPTPAPQVNGPNASTDVGASPTIDSDAPCDVSPRHSATDAGAELGATAHATANTSADIDAHTELQRIKQELALVYERLNMVENDRESLREELTVRVAEARAQALAASAVHVGTSAQVSMPIASSDDHEEDERVAKDEEENDDDDDDDVHDDDDDVDGHEDDWCGCYIDGTGRVAFCSVECAAHATAEAAVEAQAQALAASAVHVGTSAQVSMPIASSDDDGEDEARAQALAASAVHVGTSAQVSMPIASSDDHGEEQGEAKDEEENDDDDDDDDVHDDDVDVQGFVDADAQTQAEAQVEVGNGIDVDTESRALVETETVVTVAVEPDMDSDLFAKMMTLLRTPIRSLLEVEVPSCIMF